MPEAAEQPQFVPPEQHEPDSPALNNQCPECGKLCRGQGGLAIHRYRVHTLAGKRHNTRIGASNAQRQGSRKSTAKGLPKYRELHVYREALLALAKRHGISGSNLSYIRRQLAAKNIGLTEPSSSTSAAPSAPVEQVVQEQKNWAIAAQPVVNYCPHCGGSLKPFHAAADFMAKFPKV